MIRTLVLSLCVLGLSACKKPVDRETAVRKAIGALEYAVEGRDIDAVIELLTPDFAGQGNRDRRKIRQMLQLQFLRQRSVHAVVRLQELTFPREKHADAELLVVVGGTPLPEDSVLDGLRGDVFRVDLTLRDDDGWKVSKAKWRRAGGGDLLD